MALTETTRLKLAKMSLGDVSWHTNLNAGMDNADARIFRLRTLEAGTPIDPNASIQAHFKGQVYLDDTSIPMIAWWARNTAAPSVWEQLSTKSLVNPVPIRTFAILDAILGKLDTDLAAAQASITGLGTLAAKNIPTRLWTVKASDQAYSQPSEAIVTSFDRLNYPGVKDGVNKYMVSGVLQSTLGGTTYAATVRLRQGSTGAGLTDAVVGTFILGASQDSVIPFKLQTTPAVNDRITLTFQQANFSGFTIKADYTAMEILEVLD